MGAAASAAGHYYSVTVRNPDAVAKPDFVGVFGIARLAGTGRGMHVVRHCILLHVRRFRWSVSGVGRCAIVSPETRFPDEISGNGCVHVPGRWWVGVSWRK